MPGWFLEEAIDDAALCLNEIVWHTDFKEIFLVLILPPPPPAQNLLSLCARRRSLISGGSCEKMLDGVRARLSRLCNLTSRKWGGCIANGFGCVKCFMWCFIIPKAECVSGERRGMAKRWVVHGRMDVENEVLLVFNGWLCKQYAIWSGRKDSECLGDDKEKHSLFVKGDLRQNYSPVYYWRGSVLDI